MTVSDDAEAIAVCIASCTAAAFCEGVLAKVTLNSTAACVLLMGAGWGEADRSDLARGSGWGGGLAGGDAMGNCEAMGVGGRWGVGMGVGSKAEVVWRAQRPAEVQ